MGGEARQANWSILISMVTHSGVSVGEPEEEMMRAANGLSHFLPGNKTALRDGLGTQPQLLE